jgi:hypothetical protein
MGKFAHSLARYAAKSGLDSGLAPIGVGVEAETTSELVLTSGTAPADVCPQQHLS